MKKLMLAALSAVFLSLSAANLCESLVRINPDFSLTPGVASWEKVDATTYMGNRSQPRMLYSA